MAFQPLKFIQTLFRTASVFLLAAGGAAVVVAIFLIHQVTTGLPDVKTLKEFKHSNTTEVFSDDGRKIAEFTAERRYPVQFERLPKHVTHAFIAAEDAHFYEHHGIDFLGILRAVVSNLTRGKFAQGASTITQQVARGILLSSRRKEITRKIREMILARQMEKELTKSEILSLYLSDIYLGHGAYGIGAAAQNYFRKKVENLTLGEASMLAGLPQRPNDWDPFKNPGAAKRRQQYVLKRMVEEKFITLEEAKVAVKEPLRMYSLEDLNHSVCPYFSEYVRQYLMNKYKSEKVLSEGYKVYTTVRYDFQKAAEQSVVHGLRAVDKRLGWRGVAVHLDANEKIQSVLALSHEEIVEKLTPARLLRPDVELTSKKLDYDLSEFQASNSPYFGETPVREGEIYSAVVIRIEDTRVTGRIGQTPFVMPFSAMEWAIAKDVNNVPSKLVRPGDVIKVRVEKSERHRGFAQVSLEQEPEVQGALLSYEIQTGYVRAMVGGSDFGRSKFNIALQAKRQVGSTFKPIIYASAIDKGFSPASIVTDSPLVFKYEGQLDADNVGQTWRPKNYSGSFQGEIPLRLALIRSMNVPTVKVVNDIGIDYVIQYAKNMGITSPLARDLTIALGSWSSSLEELTRAYAVFPRWGEPLSLIYVRKVVDRSGRILEENIAPEFDPAAFSANPDPTKPLPKTVISPQTAYVMTDLLRAVIRDPQGTGGAAGVVPGAVAGKTGTSNDHRDAWFVGFSPHVMTGVWVGFEKDKPLDPQETGGKAAAPIFGEYMTAVVKEYPKVDFPIPDEITFAYIDRETGRLATSSSPRRVRVAFKVDAVPNLAGDNLPSIGEPGAGSGTRHTSQAAPAVPGSPSLETTPNRPVPSEGTDDFLRQGYQN